MLSKNNYRQIRQPRFSIRKLSVGVASVVIGMTVLGIQSAAADTVTPTTPTQDQPAPTSGNNDDAKAPLTDNHQATKVVDTLKTQEWVHIQYPKDSGYKNVTTKFADGIKVNLVEDADGNRQWEPVNESFSAKPISDFNLPEIKGYHPAVTQVSILRGDESKEILTKAKAVLNHLSAQFPNTEEIPTVDYDFPGQFNFYITYVQNVVDTYKNQEWLHVQYPADSGKKDDLVMVAKGKIVQQLDNGDGTATWQVVHQDFAENDLSSLNLPKIDGYHPVITRVTVSHPHDDVVNPQAAELLNSINQKLPSQAGLPAVAYDFPGQINFYLEYVKDETPVTPDEPVVPDQPTTPEQPVTSDEIDYPEQEKPAVKNPATPTEGFNNVVNTSHTTTSNQQTKLPQTGNTNHSANLIGLGLLSITSLLGLGMVRKQDHN